MSDQTQSPLVKWADDIAIVRSIQANFPGETLPDSTQFALDFADGYAALEKRLAEVELERAADAVDLIEVTRIAQIRKQGIAALEAELAALRAGTWQPSPELREALADYAHRAWSGWMEYMFGKGEPGADGTWIMPKWAVERWQRQMATYYPYLTEKEKESDRKEADEMIAIVCRLAADALDAARTQQAQKWPDEETLAAWWGEEYGRALGLAYETDGTIPINKMVANKAMSLLLARLAEVVNKQEASPQPSTPLPAHANETLRLLIAEQTRQLSTPEMLMEQWPKDALNDLGIALMWLEEQTVTPATPITADALREAGWGMTENDDGYLVAYWHGEWWNFEVVDAIDGLTVTAQGYGTEFGRIARGVHTMQQLSQLTQLLTGAPMPGGGSDEAAK